MNKVIVTTTINAVTKAIEKFDQMKDWTLVVAGDKKTPGPYRLKNGVFLTCEDQEKINRELSDLIGWNCIQRRNFGFLWAYDHGADIIAVIDDDNIPYDFWGTSLLIGKEVSTHHYDCPHEAFDPVAVTNYPHLWHRGFPIQWLSERKYPTASWENIVPDIQADFWNGDPDIDAICRMEHAPNCRFDDETFPLSSNRISPFNSQNTFLSRKVLPDYFLFPEVGRMDDIWASFHAQAQGHQVIYNRASVFQERNIHDLTKDMKAEYLGYENNHKIIRDLAKNKNAVLDFIPEKSLRAFRAYQKHLKV